MTEFTEFMRFFRDHQVLHTPTEYDDIQETFDYYCDDYQKRIETRYEYDAMISCSQAHFLFKDGKYIGTLADEMGDVQARQVSYLSDAWYCDG